MTWKEAIIKVLAEEGSPMHYVDITNKIIEKEYKQDYGATPEMTVSNQLTTNPDLFKHVGKGTFGLAETSEADLEMEVESPAYSPAASPVSSEVTPESSHTDTRKIKVKGFDDTRMDRLEAKINEFLNENDVEVVDIKFSSAAELSNGRSHSRFAALLLYRER